MDIHLKTEGKGEINQPKRVKFTNSVIFVSHPHFSM